MVTTRDHETMPVTNKTRYIYTASSGNGSESHSRIDAFNWLACSTQSMTISPVIVGYTECRAPFTPSDGTIPYDIREHVALKWLKRVRSDLIVQCRSGIADHRPGQTVETDRHGRADVRALMKSRSSFISDSPGRPCDWKAVSFESLRPCRTSILQGRLCVCGHV